MRRLGALLIIIALLFNAGGSFAFAGTSSGIQTEVFEGYFKNVNYSDPDLFLQTGKQTKATPTIRRLANQVKSDINDLEVAKEIYRLVQEAAPGGASGEKFSKTVDEILKVGYTGCTDYGLVYAAVAREVGIPTVFIQAARIDWVEDYLAKNRNMNMIRGHILVELYIDGEWYLVDSTSGKLYLDYDRNNFAIPDGYYIFAKSIEVLDSGIKNEKHNAETMKDVFKDFDPETYTANVQLMEYYDLNQDLEMIHQSREFSAESNSSPSNGSKDFYLVGKQAPVESIVGRVKCSGAMSLSVLFTKEKYDYKNADVLFLLDSEPSQDYMDDLLDLAPDFKDLKPGEAMSVTTQYDTQVGFVYGKNESELMDMLEALDVIDFMKHDGSAGISNADLLEKTDQQQQEIDELKSTIEELKAELQLLKKQVEALINQ